MLPEPEEPGSDWRGEDVLRHPARFIQRHKRRAGQSFEYEFRWLYCGDGTVYNSELSNLPLLMNQTYSRSRKFLQEIEHVQLTDKQVWDYSKLRRYPELYT